MSDYDINKMDFKQLRNEVQLLRDELAIMKRKYEDLLYNLDDDNFNSRIVKEKGDMKTAIEVNAEGIKTKVSNEEFQSTMEQTAEEIRSVVSKNISTKFKSSVKPTKANTTTAEKGMLCEHKGTLYYYNDITETWKVYPYADEITSQFLQTSSGFELIGDVSISGDAIVGGTIRGSTLQTFMSSEESGYGTYAELNAENGSFDLYYQADVGDENRPNDEKEHRFSIYQSGGTTYIENISSSLRIGNYANETTHAMNKTFPIGTWDFQYCTPINLGSVVAKFA